MSEARRVIPQDVIDVQSDASDPSASAFVSANAGSGKTHVLVQRVIRLLLDGTDPAKILCLTFTKAAAANMANRVFATLAKWTSLDDAALAEAITSIDGKPANAARCLRARRLFAQALDTPGGLKVQTIHAFCTRLLQQFPFEAQVAARFTVLEDRSEEDLIGMLRLGVLLDAASDPETALGRALSTAVAVAPDQTFSDILRAAIDKRGEITGWIAHAGGLEAAIGELSQALGLDPSDTTASVEDEIISGSVLVARDFDAVASAIESGSPNDRKQAKCLRDAALASGPEKIETYFDVFFTQKREPRKAIVTKAVAPTLAERLMAEQARLIPLKDKVCAVSVRDRTAALIRLADAVIRRYQTEKNRRGLLDYDDLIDKTLALLDDVGAAWVHYKLDLGIDHVLIDEAQDTSPKQWEIVKRLVAEFTAGAGARTLRRSIFAVGDEKQSIYSFQGAAPRAFADMRRHFHRAHEASELTFRACQFKLSFRSGPNILHAVDTVFSASTMAASVTDDEAGMPSHAALPDAAPGLVEIWPLIEPDERAAMEGWDAPFDAVPETSPPVRLARRIAATIRAWLQRGEQVSEQMLRPGDILILVRQRSTLFEAIIRALKDAQIPVAGADRLVLTEHIGVMDLMVLADALLSPYDDLALATALKSPLFGITEDELFALAHDRQGPLREALRAASEPRLRSISDRIDALGRAARNSTPFAFYAALLGPQGGRTRMLARLGFEAADALDEFLARALDYESREAPTLQGFIAWMRAASAEIKRDMDIVRDEVRVMTVHGAKGLEAPVVFVADTTTEPSPSRGPRLLRIAAERAAPGTPDRLLWPGPKESDTAVVTRARDAARRAEEDEYRRLLYVAMTRAADRLIVCGANGRRKRPDGCWYDLVHDALVPEAVEEPGLDADSVVWRWRKIPDRAPVPVEAGGSPTAPAAVALPEWLTQDVGPHRVEAILTPSTAGDTLTSRRGALSNQDRRALLRGRLVHRLMQSLPDVRLERRSEAAWRYLERAGGDLDQTDRESIAVDVLSLLTDPRFGALFGPGSRAEVPIIGRLGRTGGTIRVSGQVDRLTVGTSSVLIADYKTNRPAPARLADVPPPYITQMALYRAVLAELYPDHEIRAALVWTDGPALMELPSSAFREALDHLGVRAA